jgi:hypothetical protein
MDLLGVHVYVCPAKLLNPEAIDLNLLCWTLRSYREVYKDYYLLTCEILLYYTEIYYIPGESIVF